MMSGYVPMPAYQYNITFWSDASLELTRTNDTHAYEISAGLLDAIWVSTLLHFCIENPPKSRLGGLLGRLGSVLERPGRLLGRLGAVLVAFKVVLDVKMTSESAQDPKYHKNHNFSKFLEAMMITFGESGENALAEGAR